MCYGIFRLFKDELRKIFQIINNRFSFSGYFFFVLPLINKSINTLINNYFGTTLPVESVLDTISSSSTFQSKKGRISDA